MSIKILNHKKTTNYLIFGVIYQDIFMTKVIINETRELIIEKTQEGWLVDGKLFSPDIQSLGRNRYHIISNHKSFIAVIEKFDYVNKTLAVRINEHLYNIILQDETDLLAEKLGIRKQSALKQDTLSAPMPGLIIDVLVSEGQTVENSTPLVILKAMKMENILKAGYRAVVKKIFVKENEKIEKGAKIILFGAAETG